MSIFNKKIISVFLLTLFLISFILPFSNALADVTPTLTHNFIKETFPDYNWIFDKVIKNGISKRRPDVLLELSTHYIIVEIDEEKKPDSYEEHACEFTNEADCEEELEEDGLDLEDVEKNHFDKDEEE